jgi:hypothetical protein
MTFYDACQFDVIQNHHGDALHLQILGWAFVVIKNKLYFCMKNGIMTPPTDNMTAFMTLFCMQKASFFLKRILPY